MNGQNEKKPEWTAFLTGDFLVAILSGAMGGLLFWSWPLLREETELGSLVQLLLLVVYGAAAAIVFIFLVVGTRLQPGRLIALSLLCGLSSDTVITSAMPFVTGEQPITIEEKKSMGKEVRSADVQTESETSND